MHDPDDVQHFGSNENLLDFIREKSDDIEKAVIFGPGEVMYGGQLKFFPDFQMVLHLMNGEGRLIGRNAAEMLLNDGLLNRMNIRIEFGKV